MTRQSLQTLVFAAAAALIALSACRAEAPLDTEPARSAMYALLEAEKDPPQAEQAVNTILKAGDTRFIAVFIELLHGSQIGTVSSPDQQTIIKALAKLSGESFGDNWFQWVEWYGTTDLVPPPGFAGWKGKLLGRIDPTFELFLQDEFTSTIRIEEITWGGVVVDGIPALDYRNFITAEEADYMLPGEPVFGIQVKDDIRAYPLRILDWHEMANDVIGGRPITLSYCTLCGAAIAFDTRAADAVSLNFGSSGLLYRSNKLMYDRQTLSLWNQLTGEPVAGAWAGKDIRIEFVPVTLTTWQDWQTAHPDTLVLDINTGYSRYYEPGAAYGDYFSSPETRFPVWQRSTLLADKAQVYTVLINGMPKAYPLDVLTAERVINDTLGNTPIVLVAARGIIEVNGESLVSGAVRYSPGAEVRAYERAEMVFTPGPTPDTLLDSAGREWQITELHLEGPEGEMLPRISGNIAYWFGWYAFFPETAIYGYDAE